MALRTYTAKVATNVSGSECTAIFEVDDDELEGLSDDECAEFLQERAVDAVFEMGQVNVWCEEGDNE